MNVTKLLDHIISFEEYSSFSQLILNDPQYAIKNLQFNTATLSSVRKLIAYEIEYFNKYNEVGAAFVVFSQMLQIPLTIRSFSTEDIASVFYAFLDAVKNNYIIQTGKWSFLNKIMNNIQISCWNNQGMSSALVMHISEHLLVLATESNFHYYQKIQILSCLNNCCFACSKELRLQKFEKLNNYFIKLAHYIVECEDFYGQLTIMKTLVKWMVHREDPIKKAEIVKDWFPCHIFSKAAVNFFLTCTFRNFLEDMREFLNIQNKITKLIVSVKCRKLRVGNKLLVSGEENYSAWLDASVMAKQLTVLLDSRKIMPSNETNQHLELLIMHHQNIDIAKLNKSSEYILSIRTLKPPKFMFAAKEEILQDDSTNVTVIIEPNGDMSRFENTLRDILCEKLILQNVPDQQMPPQPATSRAKVKNYGVMREPRILKSPSSVSTSSLRQLRDNIMTAPNKFSEGKYEGVAALTRLSTVEETTERSTSANSNDFRYDNRINVETTAIVHHPKPSRLDKQNIDENEKVLKVHELNDLDTIVEDISKMQCDSLDEAIVNQLLKEAFVGITDTNENKDNNTTNERKTNGNIVNNLQNSSDVNKTSSHSKINGFRAVTESNSDSIINDTPMCYVNTRTNRRRENIDTTHEKDQHLEGINVDVIEEFFSQHIKERESGDVVVSPSVARRINKSSSSSEASEPCVGVRERIQIADSADQTASKALEDPTASGNTGIMADKEKYQTGTSRKNEIDCVTGDDKNDARISSQKSITRNSVAENAKYAVTLVFNSDDIKKSGPSQAEKREITAKAKKKGRKAAMKIPFHSVKKISIDNKTTAAYKSRELKEKSISSKIERQGEETSRTLRKRRTLFYPNLLDQNEEREKDENDPQSRDVNKSNDLSKIPVEICSTAYKEIETEKAKRKTRSVKPKAQKPRKKMVFDASPRTKKRDDVFEMVKNSADLNPIHVNTTKAPNFRANDPAVYNFTSDSEDNFITNTSEKSVLPKSSKVLVNKRGYSRNKRRLFTDETNKTQVKKKKPSRKDKTKTKAKLNNRTSNNSLIDERMRGATSNSLSAANASILITNIDNENAIEIPPLKVNTVPLMEPIPTEAHKSRRNNAANMKKSNKTDGIQNIAGVTQKNEDNENYCKGYIQKEANGKETSPLPGLVIEAVHNQDDVKDSTISTNAFTKIKQFYHNRDDMRENVADATVNITDIQIIDNDIPPGPISIDIVSHFVPVEKTENVMMICNSEGGKSEKTIDTLKTRSPIDGHGNSEESPPDPKVLKKMERPRSIETEGLIPEIKKYYSEFSNKLNAVYEKNFSDVSKKSSQRVENELLNPKVVIEKLPQHEKSINRIKTGEIQIKENKSLPVKENNLLQLEADKPNLSHSKKTARHNVEPTKTMPAGLSADSVESQNLGFCNLENFERKVSTALRTSSPKKQNDLMFDIRRLEVKISPIKNMRLINRHPEETPVSDSSNENEMYLRKNIASKKNFSYRALMNTLSKKERSVLSVSDEDLAPKKSYCLRNTSEKSENSEEDEREISEYREDTKVAKDQFNELGKNMTEIIFKNQRQTIFDKSEEEASPEIMFKKTLNSFFGKEESYTTETTFKKDLRNLFGKLEKTNTTGDTLKKNEVNTLNEINETATTDVKKNRYSYNISQRELRDLTNCVESNNTTQNQHNKTRQNEKYYLRSVVDSQSCSEAKETPFRNAVTFEESRKRTLVNQSNLLGSKKQKLAAEDQQTQFEIGSVAMGTSSSVVHWLEDAMQSTASNRDSIIQQSNENISNILERLDTTLKEINRQTSLSYLKASVDVLNGLTEMKKQLLEILKETEERWAKKSTSLIESFKEQVDDVITKDAKKKHLMMTILKEDLLATQAFLSSAKIGKKK